MTGFIESHRVVVYPWHCDHQGHMTTMHYVGMFDAAFWHHLSSMGFTRPYLDAANHGFADVKDTIEYKAEVPVGARIVIESGLLKVGRSSITALHVMRDADTGETAATSEKITVYFDLAARQSAPLPDDMRAKLEAFLVERPE